LGTVKGNRLAERGRRGGGIGRETDRNANMKLSINIK